MREIRPSGLEGGETLKTFSLPLSSEFSLRETPNASKETTPGAIAENLLARSFAA